MTSETIQERGKEIEIYIFYDNDNNASQAHQFSRAIITIALIAFGAFLRTLRPADLEKLVAQIVLTGNRTGPHRAFSMLTTGPSTLSGRHLTGQRYQIDILPNYRNAVFI